MKKIGIVIIFLQILLCTYSQNIGVLYSNDNITFENDDIEISLNSISIDSTSIESANSAVAIINGEIYDKLHTEPAVIVPCYFFSPQINRVFKIKKHCCPLKISESSLKLL